MVAHEIQALLTLSLPSCFPWCDGARFEIVVNATFYQTYGKKKITLPSGYLMPHLVELFSGTGGVSAEARRRGWKVTTVDVDPSHGATHQVDLRRFKYKDVHPDIVWASPPCNTYSLAAGWMHHRHPGGRAQSKAAHDADALLRHLLTILRFWERRNPRMRYCIENPRAHMRAQSAMLALPFRATTFYSQYGWPHDKPTDFWSNVPLALRPARKPKDRATIPMGVARSDIVLRSHTKLRHTSNAVARGQIPRPLVRSILNQLVGHKGSRSRSATSR